MTGCVWHGHDFQSFLCAGRERWTGLQRPAETCRPLLFPDGQRVDSSTAAVVDITGDGILDLVVAAGTPVDHNDVDPELWEEIKYGGLVVFEGPIDPHGSRPLFATSWKHTLWRSYYTNPEDSFDSDTAEVMTLAKGSGRPGEPALWVGGAWGSSWGLCRLWDGCQDYNTPHRTYVLGITTLDLDHPRPLEYDASVYLAGEDIGDLFGITLDRIEFAAPDGSPGLLINSAAAPYNGDPAGRIDIYSMTDLATH